MHLVNQSSLKKFSKVRLQSTSRPELPSPNIHTLSLSLTDNEWISCSTSFVERLNVIQTFP